MSSPSSRGSWANVEKEGNVRQVLVSLTLPSLNVVSKPSQDRDIGKNVVRVTGSNSINNYLQIPSSKQGLGLTGSFLYLQLKPMGPKLFTIHIEVLAKDNFVTRITVSNMFRVFRRRGNSIQVPVDLEPVWHTLAFDLPYLLCTYKDKVHTDEYWCVKGVNICSNVLVRNVFTSDSAYFPEPTKQKPFPKALLLTKERVGEFKWLPEAPTNVFYEPSPVVPSHSVAAGTAGHLPSPPTATKSNKENENTPQHQPASKPSKPKQERKTLPKATVKLRPDPIMELFTYVGYSSSTSAAKPVWSRNGQKVLFSSSCNIVIAAPNSIKQEQTVLFGHTDNVNCLALDYDNNLLASSQEGKSPVIRLWDTTTNKCVAVIASCVGGDLHSLDFSGDSNLLCTAGRDENNRTQICVYDVAGVLASKRDQKGFVQQEKVSLVARQTSEFEINCVKFAPYDAFQLISCGRENVRFWRVRNRHLPACPVILNEYARGSVFTDIAFESNFGGGASKSLSNVSFDRRVFCSMDSGSVAAIHYERRLLLCVYKLHDGPIHSISVNEGFCVTGSSDTFVRVWPLTFGDVFLEANYEAPVTAVDFAPDGLKVLVGVTDGTLGVLDVTTQTHSTKLRSHKGDINSVAFRPKCPGNTSSEMATAANDGTVRVWSVPLCEQMYEFTSRGDSGLCLSYHPDAEKHVILCAYKSGFLRVFDVERVALLYEFKQHIGPINGLGVIKSRTFTSGIDGQVCVYDNTAGYQPVKMISVTLTSAAESVPPASTSTSKNNSVSVNGNLLAVVNPEGTEIVLLSSIDSELLDDIVPVLRISRPTRSFSDKPGRFESIIFQNDEILATTENNRICKFRVFNHDTEGWGAVLTKDVHSFHPEYVSAVAQSPERGAFLVSAGSDYMLQVWDSKLKSTNAGVPTLQRFLGHSRNVNDVKFSPDGRYLVSAGSGQTIIVWKFYGNDTEHLQQYSTLELNKSRLDQQQDTSVVEPQQNATSIVLPSVQYRRYGDRCSSSAQELSIRLEQDNKQVLGLNCHSCSNMVWHPSTGLYLYISGTTLVCEDISSQKQQHYQLHEAEISTMAISSDGRLVATGSGSLSPNADTLDMSCEIYIWKPTKRGKFEGSKLVGHIRGGVQGLDFSPDCRYLVSIGSASDDMLSIWSVKYNTLLSSLRSTVMLNAVCWSRDGTAILTAGGDGQLGLWTFDEGNEELSYDSIALTFDDQVNHLTSLSQAPLRLERAHASSTVVVVGDVAGHCTVMALPQRTILAQWQASENEITSLQWCERVIVCGVVSGKVILWDIGEAYPEVGSLPSNVFKFNPKTRILGMKWHHRGADGIVTTSDSTAWYINVPSEELTPLGRGHEFAQALKSNNSGTLLYAFGKNYFRIWELEGMELVAEIVSSASKNKVATCCSFVNPLEIGYGYIVVGFSNGVVRIIEIGSSNVVSKFQIFDESDGVVALESSGSWIIAASQSGLLQARKLEPESLELGFMVDLENGREDEGGVSALGSPVSSMSCSKFMPELLVCTTANGDVIVYEFLEDEIQKLLALEDHNIQFASFSDMDPDLLVAASCNTIYEIKVDETGDILASVRTPGHVTAVDGDFVGTRNGNVYRLEGKDSIELIYAGHATQVQALSSVPSRSSYFSASNSEIVRHQL